MKRSDLIMAYLGALGACAVVILTGPDGMSVLCPGPPGNETPFETLWFSKPQHVELVLAQCPEGWVDLTPAALRDEVVNAAAVLGATFRTAAEVEMAAAEAVAEIVGRVEIMRSSGQLASVNRDYKIYRQAQISRGQKVTPYQHHLDAFTRSLVVLAAQNS